jgi:hypothetical protein
MSDSISSIASLPRSDSVQPMVDWVSACTEYITQAQRIQFAALSGWQRSITAINNELWDEWQCRFAGGVPIDA